MDSGAHRSPGGETHHDTLALTAGEVPLDSSPQPERGFVCTVQASHGRYVKSLSRGLIRFSWVCLTHGAFSVGCHRKEGGWFVIPESLLCVWLKDSARDLHQTHFGQAPRQSQSAFVSGPQACTDDNRSRGQRLERNQDC